MRQLPPLLVLALAVVLAGCGSSDDAATTATRTAAAPPPAAALDDRSFVATAVRGRRLVPGSELTLSFDDGQLGARAGCNSLGAAYSLADGRLRLDGDPAMTMIGCAPALMDQDEWLRDFLAAGPRATLAGERLSLRHGGVAVELAEGAPGGAPPPLVGTRWTLETIASDGPDGAASSVPAGVEPPTLRLTRDGRAELFTGCNRGSAQATVRDDGFVVFGPFALTRTACTDAGSTEVERAVTALLDGEVASGFDGPRLTLSKDGRSLTFRSR